MEKKVWEKPRLAELSVQHTKCIGSGNEGSQFQPTYGSTSSWNWWGNWWSWGKRRR